MVRSTLQLILPHATSSLVYNSPTPPRRRLENSQSKKSGPRKKTNKDNEKEEMKVPFLIIRQMRK